MQLGIIRLSRAIAVVELDLGISHEFGDKLIGDFRDQPGPSNLSNASGELYVGGHVNPGRVSLGNERAQHGHFPTAGALSVDALAVKLDFFCIFVILDLRLALEAGLERPYLGRNFSADRAIVLRAQILRARKALGDPRHIVEEIPIRWKWWRHNEVLLDFHGLSPKGSERMAQRSHIANIRLLIVAATPRAPLNVPAKAPVAGGKAR